MSTQENLDLVKMGYQLFAEGNIPALIELQTEDVVWEIAPGASEGVVPYAGTFRGRDGVARFFEAFAGAVETERFEPRRFLAQDDQVVVFGHSREVAKPNGKAYESDWAMAFTVRDGKVAAMRSYTDTAAAVAAWQGV